jgi:hypothetical protein
MSANKAETVERRKLDLKQPPNVELIPVLSVNSHVLAGEMHDADVLVGLELS